MLSFLKSFSLFASIVNRWMRWREANEIKEAARDEMEAEELAGIRKANDTRRKLRSDIEYRNRMRDRFR